MRKIKDRMLHVTFAFVGLVAIVAVVTIEFVRCDVFGFKTLFPDEDDRYDY